MRAELGERVEWGGVVDRQLAWCLCGYSERNFFTHSCNCACARLCAMYGSCVNSFTLIS